MTLEEESRPDKAKESDTIIYFIDYRLVRNVTDFSSNLYLSMTTDCNLEAKLEELDRREEIASGS